jgi:hypothetical protein
MTCSQRRIWLDPAAHNNAGDHAPRPPEQAAQTSVPVLRSAVSSPRAWMRPPANAVARRYELGPAVSALGNPRRQARAAAG